MQRVHDGRAQHTCDSGFRAGIRLRNSHSQPDPGAYLTSDRPS